MIQSHMFCHRLKSATLREHVKMTKDGNGACLKITDFKVRKHIEAEIVRGYDPNGYDRK